MALSLRSSANNTSIIILGWRFHCVQAQLFNNLWMALSLRSSAASRIGLTQSPLKTSADFLHLGQ